MKMWSIVWNMYLNYESKKKFSTAQSATYDKIFIFKNFSKRLFKKEYIFDYLFFCKIIINYIIIICLVVSEIFEDFSRYAFKSGILKQSYFSLYIKFKKRNSNWYHLLYAKL